MFNKDEVADSSLKEDIQRLSEGLNDLKGDLKNLLSGAVSAAGSGLHEIQSGAHNVAESARRSLSGAKDLASDKYGEAKESTLEAADCVERFVNRNPVASLGIAAGLGVALYMVMSRPRS